MNNPECPSDHLSLSHVERPCLRLFSQGYFSLVFFFFFLVMTQSATKAGHLSKCSYYSFSFIKFFKRMTLPLCCRQIPPDGVIINLSGFSFTIFHQYSGSSSRTSKWQCSGFSQLTKCCDCNLHCFPPIRSHIQNEKQGLLLFIQHESNSCFLYFLILLLPLDRGRRLPSLCLCFPSQAFTLAPFFKKKKHSDLSLSPAAFPWPPEFSKT